MQLTQQLDIRRNSEHEAVKAPIASCLVSRFALILDTLAYEMLFVPKQPMDIVEVRFHLENGKVENVIE